MRFHPLPLALLALIAACDESQPLVFPGDEEEVVDEAEEVTEEEQGGSDDASSAIPPSIDEILDEGTIEIDVSGTREARGDIVRTEANSGSGGVAEQFFINQDDDTLEVDNLAFDGFNVYTRGANTTPAQLSDLGSIAVYHGDVVVPDFLTGNDVDQVVPYVAIAGQSDVIISAEAPLLDEEGNVIDAGITSPLPRSQFTIIRTGGYFGFGFGGYGYQRAGDTVIPESGQAVFDGDYAALRVYNKLEQIEAIEGKVQIRVDFDDFNDLPGIAGEIYDRQAYTTGGVALPTYRGDDRREIDTDQIRLTGQTASSADGDLVALSTFTETIGLPDGQQDTATPGTPDVRPYVAGDVIQLPDLPIVVRGFGDSIAADGEISGEIRNRFINPSTGRLAVYEDGFYYGAFAGDLTQGDGGEVVGVVVHESPDSRYDPQEGIVAQETGGFIAKR